MQDRKRDTDVLNRLWNSMGEGEGGMFWENSTETSILSRVEFFKQKKMKNQESYRLNLPYE